MLNSEDFHARTTYIKIRHHFVRYGQIQLNHIKLGLIEITGLDKILVSTGKTDRMNK